MDRQDGRDHVTGGCQKWSEIGVESGNKRGKSIVLGFIGRFLLEETMNVEVN